MKTNTGDVTQISHSIGKAIEMAARHWRAGYDEMTIAMVSEHRRKYAVDLVHKAIAIQGTASGLTTRELATIIVDTSEFAAMGFDALDTTPRLIWSHRLMRQISGFMVSSNNV